MSAVPRRVAPFGGSCFDDDDSVFSVRNLRREVESVLIWSTDDSGSGHRRFTSNPALMARSHHWRTACCARGDDTTFLLAALGSPAIASVGRALNCTKKEFTTGSHALLQARWFLPTVPTLFSREALPCCCRAKTMSLEIGCESDYSAGAARRVAVLAYNRLWRVVCASLLPVRFGDQPGSIFPAGREVMINQLYRDASVRGDFSPGSERRIRLLNATLFSHGYGEAPPFGSHADRLTLCIFFSVL